MSTYIGKCKVRACKHATRCGEADVQELDSDRRAPADEHGARIYLTADGAEYDPSRPYILNAMHVCARCPEHGVYRLEYLRGRVVESIRCDARCQNATGSKCDCQCGGANHGANHAR